MNGHAGPPTHVVEQPSVTLLDELSVRPINPIRRPSARCIPTEHRPAWHSRVEQDVIEALGLDSDLDGLVLISVGSVPVDSLVGRVSLGVLGLVGRVSGVEGSEVRGQGERSVDGGLRNERAEELRC